MKNLLVLVAFLVFTAPVYADTYKWVDHKGTINFTEDLGNVPTKYRKAVKIFEEDEKSTVEVIEISDNSQSEKGSVVESKRKEKELSPSGIQEKKKILYGDKDAESWRREYGTVKLGLRGVEGQLAANRKILQDTSKMSRTEYLTITNTNKAFEQRIVDLREELDTLKQSAISVGVPTGLLE